MVWNYNELDKEIQKEEQQKNQQEEEKRLVDLYTISCEEFYNVY